MGICMPFESDDDTHDIQAFFQLKQQQQQQKQYKQIMKEIHMEKIIKKMCNKQTQKVKPYKMPIPAIIIPPPINISPTTSQILLALTPQYIEDEDIDKPLNIDLDSKMHIRANITPTPTIHVQQSSRILIIDDISTQNVTNNTTDLHNNTGQRDNNWCFDNVTDDSDTSNDYSDDEFSDWCDDEFISDYTQESFVDIVN